MTEECLIMETEKYSFHKRTWLRCVSISNDHNKINRFQTQFQRIPKIYKNNYMQDIRTAKAAYFFIIGLI